MTVKRFYKIIRRAGCCEQRKASWKTSAGLDESSVYQKKRKRQLIFMLLLET